MSSSYKVRLVVKQGTGLTVSMTKELASIGLEKGDNVLVIANKKSIVLCGELEIDKVFVPIPRDKFQKLSMLLKKYRDSDVETCLCDFAEAEIKKFEGFWTKPILKIK